MLGPVRFQHIETCTREVCRLFKALEDVEVYIPQLEALDQEIVALRAELGHLTNPADATPTLPAAGSGKKQDYAVSLLEPRPDLAKAQRLVRARQGTINSLRSSIQRSSQPTLSG